MCQGSSIHSQEDDGKDTYMRAVIYNEKNKNPNNNMGVSPMKPGRKAKKETNKNERKVETEVEGILCRGSRKPKSGEQSRKRDRCRKMSEERQTR